MDIPNKACLLKQFQSLSASVQAPHPCSPELGLLSFELADVDRKWVALDDPVTAQSWIAQLGCTRSELEAAVHAVGHSSRQVSSYLAQMSGDRQPHHPADAYQAVP
jgi:hypothetical protein